MEVVAVVVGAVGVVFAYIAARRAGRSNRIASEARDTSRAALEVGRESLEVSQESFRFAKEQAALSPELRVSVTFLRDYGPDTACIQIQVTNEGAKPATHMRGWIIFHRNNFERPKKRSTNTELLMASRRSKQPRGILFGHSDEPDAQGQYEAVLYNDLPHVPGITHLYEVEGRIRDTGYFPVHVKITSAEGILHDEVTDLGVPEHLGPLL